MKITSLLLTTLFVILFSCKKDSPPKIPNPQVNSISPTMVKPGDLITITGSDLTIKDQQTSVSLDGEEVLIVSKESTKLVVIAPSINKPSYVKITVGSKIFIYSTPLTKAQTWFPATNPEIAAKRNDLFSIGEKGYCFLNRKLYEYSPENNSWTYKVDFPGNIFSESFKFTIGQKLYIGGGYGNDPLHGLIRSKEFWVFNQATNLWTRLGDINNSQDNYKTITPWAFSLNGLGYICTYDGHFSCYNPQSDQWTQKNDLPTKSTPNGTVVINNTAYLLIANRLWEYNAVKDQFTAKSVCSGSFSYSLNGGLAYQESAFFMNGPGETFRYIPSLDLWIQMDHYPAYCEIEIPAFVLGKKVYFGSFGGGGLQDCQYTLNYIQF